MTDPDKIALELIREQQNRVMSIQSNAIERSVAEFLAKVVATKDIATTAMLHSYWNKVERAASLLADQVDSAVVAGVDRMIEKVLSTWRDAGAEEAGPRKDDYLKYLAPLSATVLFGLLAPRLWKTVLSRYVHQAAIEVGTTYSDLLRRGMDPDLLARRLRKYVLGAESFQDAFPDIDLNIIPSNLRSSAGQMIFNSTRLAFTEFHNARALAEVKLWLLDPLVGAVQWTLSPNRGTLKSPDECDLLAKGDFYGLGEGVYPVARVPRTPHPFDRCERIPIRRDWSRRNDTKPDPNLLITPLDTSIIFPRGGRITANAATRARHSALGAIMNPMA